MILDDTRFTQVLHNRRTDPGLVKFPVHAGDIGDGNLLGAFCFAFSFIGAVAET